MNQWRDTSLPILERLISLDPCYTPLRLRRMLRSNETVLATLEGLDRQELSWLVARTVGAKSRAVLMASLPPRKGECGGACLLCRIDGLTGAQARRLVRWLLQHSYKLDPSTRCDELV